MSSRNELALCLFTTRGRLLSRLNTMAQAVTALTWVHWVLSSDLGQDPKNSDRIVLVLLSPCQANDGIEHR
jgi:hypothetical protein